MIEFDTFAQIFVKQVEDWIFFQLNCSSAEEKKTIKSAADFCRLQRQLLKPIFSCVATAGEVKPASTQVQAETNALFSANKGGRYKVMIVLTYRYVLMNAMQPLPAIYYSPNQTNYLTVMASWNEKLNLIRPPKELPNHCSALPLLCHISGSILT